MKIVAISMASGGAPTPQMNVTPLIDALLVPIIIFIVIVAQSKEKGVEGQIPQPPSKSDTSPAIARTIVIQVGQAKSGDVPVLKINPQEVSWAAVRVRCGTSSSGARRRWPSCKATTPWISSTWPM